MKIHNGFIRKTGLQISLIWILFGIVLTTDFLTPLGFAHGLLYLPILIYAMLLPNATKRFQQALLSTSVASIALSYILIPNLSNLPDLYIVSNRTLSIIVLVLTYGYFRKLQIIKTQFSEITKLEQVQRKTLYDFIDALPVQVWQADSNGCIDFLSSNLLEFSGKSRETILDNWLMLIHPDDREKTIDAWTRSVETGVPYQLNFRMQRNDGEYIWFQNQAVAQLNKDGKIERWLGSSINIDDLCRFRDKSERLAEQFRHTVESITDAFFTLDHDFRFTYINQHAAEIMGSSVGEMLGQIIWEKCSIGYQSPFAKKYRFSAQTHKKLHFEEYFSPRDKWLEVHVYPSPDGLTVYFADISEQRKEREQLKLLNTAVSKLNDVIIITEAEILDEPGPKIVFVNQAFERVTGYSSHEVIGRCPRLLQGPNTDRKELDRIKTALKDAKPVSAQLINYSKSGREYVLEIEIVPLADKSGHLTHFVAVQRDITDRIDMEQRLRESQKLEAVGHLTGGVAHDFNNLLTVIMGNAEMMTELVTEPNLRSMAGMTLSAAQRGAQLTSRLLAFARRQPLNPKSTDLNQLAQLMHPLIRRTLPENIEFEFVPDLELGITEIDAGELDTALLNLVVNARDAMPDGGKLTIETANAVLDDGYAAHHAEVVPGEYVMISVSDTGCGMTPDTVRRAFEPFFTTKSVGKGSGLGLSMVFGFTKQSGGHLNIYSEQGEGTSIKLYFPRIQGAQKSTYKPTVERQPEGGTEHILIAEDDELVLKHLEAQLRFLGYRVTAVSSGPKALNVLETQDDIDLLLTDIIMPGGMNGRELSDRARAARPSLKVLYTSGYTENAIVHHGRLDPGVDLLSKPYSRFELANKVREVIDG